MRGLLVCLSAWMSVVFLAAGCSNSTAGCSDDGDCPDGRCVDGQCLPGSDRDHDGVLDGDDNCPDTPNPDQADRDGDGAGDACDPCPDTELNDPDGDGVCNDVDNCPEVANPDQADSDGDGAGDACDPCPTGAEDDADGDGTCDDGDNCPGVANPDQADSDGDGAGDACDPCPDDPGDDSDGDGACDSDDNCPATANPDQTDSDDDGAGDACDPCPHDPSDDDDGDGTCEDEDNCPGLANPDQADADGDGAGDACDPCPADPDDDSDGDGLCADEDNCPQDYNPDQADSDGDGIGDLCDDTADDFRDGGPTNPDCTFTPPRAEFAPEEEVGWSSSDLLPDKVQVMATPTVVNLTDDDGDGDVDADDTPDVVFNGFDTYACGEYICLGAGALRAVAGDSFTDLWAVSPVGDQPAPAASIAAGDIDGDGLVELATLRFHGGVIVFDTHPAGPPTVKWSCAALDNCDDYALLHGGNQWGGPAIADIDQDGTPEVIHGAHVYGPNGALLWVGTGGIGDNGVGPLSAVADLDGIAPAELVTGNTFYHADGSIYWDGSGSYGDGFVALGDFDDDDSPEVVVVSDGTVRLHEHDGALAWGPVALPGAGDGGPPTVADFDGDGQPEIGIADRDTYVMLETDGSLSWQEATQDHSSSRTGSSVFDFEADGYAEVVYNDETHLRIYDGASGEVLWERENSSATAYEYPVIADVDNDGNAELVVCANDFAFGSHHGIRVFGDLEDNWVRTRRIWNQHTYHISNIHEDGSVPQAEQDGWLLYNSYRQNELAPGEGQAIEAPDLASDLPSALTGTCPDSVVLRVWVENRGAIEVAAGIPVAFYAGDPDAGGSLIDVAYTSRALQPGQAQRVDYTWIDPPVGSTVDVHLVVDDFGNGEGWNNECDEDAGGQAANNHGIIQAVGCP